MERKVDHRNYHSLDKKVTVETVTSPLSSTRVWYMTVAPSPFRFTAKLYLNFLSSCPVDFQPSRRPLTGRSRGLEPILNSYIDLEPIFLSIPKLSGILRTSFGYCSMWLYIFHRDVVRRDLSRALTGASECPRRMSIVVKSELNNGMRSEIENETIFRMKGGIESELENGMVVKNERGDGIKISSMTEIEIEDEPGTESNINLYKI
ncbi:hypothetical protein EVAR_36743_1 [Eumeta japonica]|uniref:Uncharacterized protein n=1 Tax=Eumeta variegata TaxID=151549 RepID=A0A4C1WZY2_EUMVA|nr:hypothetical protein EVAR_36743_1 [Eumeta japonica]